MAGLTFEALCLVRWSFIRDTQMNKSEYQSGEQIGRKFRCPSRLFPLEKSHETQAVFKCGSRRYPHGGSRRCADAIASYGTVPVTGNNVLESAYRAAFDRCSAYAYPSYDRFGQYGGAYRSPAMSRCMSRMGFIQENGVTFAYPVRKAAYLPR